MGDFGALGRTFGRAPHRRVHRLFLDAKGRELTGELEKLIDERKQKVDQRNEIRETLETRHKENPDIANEIDELGHEEFKKLMMKSVSLDNEINEVNERVKDVTDPLANFGANFS